MKMECGCKGVRRDRVRMRAVRMERQSEDASS